MERYYNAKVSTIILGFSFVGVSSYLLTIYPGGAAFMGSIGIVITGLCIDETKKLRESSSNHNRRKTDI